MSPNQQLEEIEKICREAKEKADKLPHDRKDNYGPTINAMEVMIVRSRALLAIEQLVEKHDAGDVDTIERRLEKIIRETEAKVDGLDPDEGSALSYYSLGYQKMKTLIEDSLGTTQLPRAR